MASQPPLCQQKRLSSAPRPALNNRCSARKTWSAAPSNRSDSQRRPGLNSGAMSPLSISHKEFSTHAHVSPRDGRVHISVNALKQDGLLPRVLVSLNERKLAGVVEKTEDAQKAPPKLNIVVMVIGSRGDVQPFIAVCKVLREQWGHRVRLATHGTFREFVEGHGIEFFDVGGNPSELMAFMVKNPGLLPNVETIRAGEISRRREQMSEMFEGFWKACIEPTDNYERLRSNETSRTDSTHGTGIDSEKIDQDAEPFIADAIIANPPSFAHVHCAEKLGIPLHLMFTFPYSPTQDIPHPLAFIQNSNMGREYTNALTYPLVEMMIWQGLGDLINRFRKKTLALEPVATLWAPGMISRLRVPYTYMWSPALIPKPSDWGDNIDITGFIFLDQTKDYEPPSKLRKFLEAGEAPIYIGFGSIVVDNPDALTATIFEAVKAAGVRALVSKGWGGLGGEGGDAIPDNIHMLENTPHDWLFAKVSAVVHHGGAGTTAIGLFHGKPTMVVPFFGDQAFWGSMISNANAGPPPIPHKELTAENLAEGIKALLCEDCQKAAKAISRKIKEEDGDGANNAVQSFYKGLAELDQKGKRGLGRCGKTYGEGGPMGPGEGKWGIGGPGIRCNILGEKIAVWRIKRTKVRLSVVAAAWLIERGFIDTKDLRLLRHTEWNDFDGPGEPLSGGFSALFSSIAGVAKGLFGIPKTLLKGAKRFDDEVDLAAEVQELAEELKPATTRRRFRCSFPKAKVATTSKPPSIDRPSFESVTTAVNTAQNTATWSSSPSRSRSPDPHHHGHDHSISTDIVRGTKKSVSKIGRSAARAPLNISLAITQGFHNAPRLYGDEVRHPARITGFYSGIRAAGKEFTLGIYDGFTGLVVKPYEGVRDRGVKGAITGVGKGLGGLVFKTQAGIAGVVGFSLKGVHKELRKGRDRKVLYRIMEARTRQGLLELRQAKEVSRGEVLETRMKEGWERISRESESERRRQTGFLGRRMKERREMKETRRSSIRVSASVDRNIRGDVDDEAQANRVGNVAEDNAVAPPRKPLQEVKQERRMRSYTA